MGGGIYTPLLPEFGTYSPSSAEFSPDSPVPAGEVVELLGVPPRPVLRPFCNFIALRALNDQYLKKTYCFTKFWRKLN